MSDDRIAKFVQRVCRPRASLQSSERGQRSAIIRHQSSVITVVAVMLHAEI
jgi:hypothetical protein